MGSSLTPRRRRRRRSVGGGSGGVVFASRRATGSSLGAWRHRADDDGWRPSRRWWRSIGAAFSRWCVSGRRPRAGSLAIEARLRASVAEWVAFVGSGVSGGGRGLSGLVRLPTDLGRSWYIRDEYTALANTVVVFLGTTWPAGPRMATRGAPKGRSRGARTLPLGSTQHKIFWVYSVKLRHLHLCSINTKDCYYVGGPSVPATW